MSKPVPGNPKIDAQCRALVALLDTLVDDDFAKNQSHNNLKDLYVSTVRVAGIAAKHRVLKAEQREGGKKGAARRKKKRGPAGQ